MKKILFIIILHCLISCGTNEHVEKTDMDIVSDTNVFISSSAFSEVLPVEVEQVFELKDRNTIKDYAEYFLQANVYTNDEIEKNRPEDAYFNYYVLDEKKGYAHINGSFEGDFYFAIWQLANGNDLVGKMTAYCGPACNYVCNFYEITPVGEMEITALILPMDEIELKRQQVEDELRMTGDIEKDILPAQTKFIFPQKGTSIDVYFSANSNELEFPMLTLDWDGEKFAVAQIFDIPITKP